MNKFYSVIITLLVGVISLNAAELKVKSLIHDPFDITASTKPRLDRNGMPCALVIVELPVEGAVFLGNVVGDTPMTVNEYYVYLTRGTKMMKIQTPGYETLSIDFRDLDLSDGLDSQATYRMKISGYDTATKGTESVKEKPLTGKLDGHDYVDLGLPSGTLWATTNVGAKNPWDNGDYFYWGQTSTNATKAWEPTAKNDNPDIRKSPFRDAAYANRGFNWTMPSVAQVEELLDYCRWESVSDHGRAGFKITGPNGQSIFLPLTGYKRYGDINEKNQLGQYWCGDKTGAGLFLQKKTKPNATVFRLGEGRTIRPVVIPK